MDPERLAQQLEKLNENLQETRAALRTLTSNIKDMAAHTKATAALAKQVYILNQILLQVSKKSGNAAMISSLLDAFIDLARRSH